MINHLKKYAMMGLLAIVPVAITVAIVDKVIEISDRVMVYIPESYHSKALIGVHIPGQGMVIVFAGLVLIGFLLKNRVGTYIHNQMVRLINRIPGVKSIFNIVRQLMDSVVNSSNSFKRAYAIEYPQPGQWTIAFETSDKRSEVHDKLIEATQGLSPQLAITDPVNIYVPTTPNPTSGFYLITDRSRLIELDMPIEDALKVLVTGGVVIPPAAQASKPSGRAA
jgi:uncharacterized membrane protein